MYDITALGEILIDFTPATSMDGKTVFEQNPGGAPANLLAVVSRYGGRTAMIGKVGQDMFGDFLIETLHQNGIEERGEKRMLLMQHPFSFHLFGCIVIKIALNEDDRRAFISRTGGQVAKGTDQVGETARCRSFGCHLTHQITILFLNLVLDRFFECFSGEISKLIISQIFQL